MTTAARKLTMAQAISEAIAQEMERDPKVFVMGEDIGKYGGIFGATGGLLDRFGPERIMDTPISETAFIGAATGAAAEGMRPIAELMFVDFFGVCMDQIYNHLAKNTYMSGGNVRLPRGAHDGHRRRLQRRRAALAVAVRAVRARARAEGGGAVERVRREGVDDPGDPRRQPGDVLLPQRHHGAAVDGVLRGQQRRSAGRGVHRSRSARRASPARAPTSRSSP